MKISMPVCPVAFFRDSNDSRDDWREPSSEFDIAACGRNGGASISVSVHGYWSTDVIKLYVNRRIAWRGEEVSSWEVELSHSSGGRLTETDEKNYPEPYYKGIKDSLEAEENFGRALIVAAAFGREIAKYTTQLEEHYQLRRAELHAEREAEKAAHAARVEADLPLGVAAAHELFVKATADLGMYAERRIMVYQRGADWPVELVISRKQNFTFRFMGDVISRKKALAELATASNRSHIKV
jgi:hypothetical protein